MQSLLFCDRSKSPNDLPAFPWVDAVSFAVPVALADVHDVEGQREHEDQRIEVAELRYAGHALVLIHDERDGGEQVADEHEDGDPDALAAHVVPADDEVDEQNGHGEVHTPGRVGAAHAERIVSRRGGPELVLAHDDDQPAEYECHSYQRIHGLLGQGRVVHLAEFQEVVQDDDVQKAPDDVDRPLRERTRCDERIVEFPREVQGQGPERHTMRFIDVSAMDDEDVCQGPEQPGHDVAEQIKRRQVQCRHKSFSFHTKLGKW